MALYFRFVFVGVLCLLMTGQARADHMNGVYYGLDNVSGYVLEVTQRGTSLEADLTSSDGAMLELFGSTNGGDYGSGQFEGADTGTFELQWTSQGITLDLRGQRHNGRGLFASGPPAQQPRQPPMQPDREENAGRTWQPPQGENAGPPATEGNGAASGMPNVD